MVESPRKITSAMKKVDFILITGFALIVSLFTFVGYSRILTTAEVISSKFSSNVVVAEPPLVIDLCKAEGLAYTTPPSCLTVGDNNGGIQTETVNPQVVGENASNNWGQ